ncbi:Type cbb3 cytochrome oxidase biogenesis protein CcoG, involved in Cu oxidation [Georgfuchsia toluolica]|uniref:Type cbb3 cytochrome oxidase biogenesis protein CcoG, involved in Cu oxidation n=2 Tax=Georgfuchsia toluolica TaxID=424218 RepID=A0A916N1E4_9PROT|nr:Type cbb3 cytochrome oxidase biogenesis protein CcoG, involved in Cu oxidation [Georgfuchsia toluolica]
MATPPPAAEIADTDVEVSLYEVRKKIHPRAVHGWFATWRWLFIFISQAVYYGLCWLPWNGRQAVLFDLVQRKFYIFGMVFWPQDVFFLAVLLIICALSLFLFTAIGGRLWCGFACPQTVYTEIFLWIERLIEGDRPARIRLDSAPLSAEKVGRRGAKHGVWLLFSLWTGFTFVGYFTPIKSLVAEVVSLSLGPWEMFWIAFYGMATYGNAGWLREQVCKYMCPYARFQGVMFDPDTLTVTYDGERGEPRGFRSRNVDRHAKGLGDCIDCGICVQVCPTGIDIRDGLQYECIGCSACIDGCNQVMDKMGYPRGLIRYTTQHALKEHWNWRQILRHIIRPRILIYSAILGMIIAAFLWGLGHKPGLRVDVIRDRATMAREVEDEQIENVFRLQVMNVSEKNQRYSLAVSGIEGIRIEGQNEIEVAATTTRSITVAVRAPEHSGHEGSNRIYFDVRSLNDANVAVHEKAIFIEP